MRVRGQNYIGFRRPRNQKLTLQDVERNTRVMGPTCTSAVCKKSIKRNCNKINENERLAIFKAFWKNLQTWE